MKIGFKWLFLWGTLCFTIATFTAISNLDGAEISDEETQRVFHPVQGSDGKAFEVSNQAEK